MGEAEKKIPDFTYHFNRYQLLHICHYPGFSNYTYFAFYWGVFKSDQNVARVLFRSGVDFLHGLAVPLDDLDGGVPGQNMNLLKIAGYSTMGSKDENRRSRLKNGRAPITWRNRKTRKSYVRLRLRLLMDAPSIQDALRNKKDSLDRALIAARMDVTLQEDLLKFCFRDQ